MTPEETAEKLNAVGICLAAAVRLTANTCAVTGQGDLAMHLVTMWRDERFAELAAVFETMSASLPPELAPLKH